MALWLFSNVLYFAFHIEAEYQYVLTDVLIFLAISAWMFLETVFLLKERYIQ